MMLPKLDRTGASSLPAAAGKRKSMMIFESFLGVMTAFVCTECGYQESYVNSPGEVPWNDLEGGVWLNPDAPDATGPFR
jgi:hypothetical protein